VRSAIWHGLAGLLGQATSAKPQVEMPIENCAAIFRFSIFI
jgi:hypothetical protein